LDPSDVVQEAFVEIVQRLPEYLRTRPLPIYPWLRRITWEQLMHLHAHHLGTRKRTPLREEHLGTGLSDDSVMLLAKRVAAGQSSPSRQAIRKEAQERVRQALEQLDNGDRELLILKYLEQLRTREIAAVLQIGEGAVRMRHLRALERLRELLGRNGEDSS
jgi:RNA polymerase sigma-70 factor (subfamily 1)